MLNDEALSQKTIGAAIAVHKQLGPCFLESIYEEALTLEFKALNIQFSRQSPVRIYYRNQLIGEHRLDFLVENLIVVELKTVHDLEKIHFSIVRSYLKATGLQSGLIFNFAAMPLTIKRVGREISARESCFLSS